MARFSYQSEGLAPSRIDVVVRKPQRERIAELFEGVRLMRDEPPRRLQSGKSLRIRHRIVFNLERERPLHWGTRFVYTIHEDGGVMQLPEEIVAHRIEILQLAQHYGAHDIRIFGSMARGDYRPDSDVDVLVRFTAGHSLLDLLRFERDLAALLHRPVDVVSEKGIPEMIRADVLREAVTL